MQVIVTGASDDKASCDDRLRQHAAAAGVTVPELLRREMRRLASRPTINEWIDRTRRHPGDVDRRDVLAALDELKGQWPDAGH